MASPTDLTDRIAQLRERKERSPAGRVRGTGAAKPRGRRPGRRLAPDLFTLFAYALLGLALTGQVALILVLDIW